MNESRYTETLAIKQAPVGPLVLPQIRDRFSPRSFTGEPLPEEVGQALLEAASWAPSANNEQPWRYLLAVKGTPAFDAVFAALVPGNAAWAGGASALLVAVARTRFAATGKPNAWAEHDLGLANGFLMLQAVSLGWYTHPMAGFDGAALSASLNLGEDEKPLVVMALGRPDSPDKLEEPFRTRERTPRSRMPVSEIAIAFPA